MAKGWASWARFSVIGLGTLIGPLDSAVNIAFPAITGAFAIPLASIQWVVICYVLTYASLMLVFGRLGDQWGRLRIFQLGLGLSVVGLVLCAGTDRFEWLLAFRVIQGVGTAMVISCGPALVTGLFDEAVRPRVLGAYTMVFGLGGAVGPSLGGLLVEAWGWPAVFWFRLPIALLALALTIAIPMPVRARAGGSFDLLGAILLAASLALLLFTVNQLRGPGVGPAILIALGAGTIVVFAGFLLQERRAATPIIKLGQFRDLDFTLFNLVNIAVNLTGFSVLLLVPFFLVYATELPLSLGGVVLAAGPLGMIAAAQAGGQLAHRIGANRIAFLGVVLVVLGTLSVGLWRDGETMMVMIATLIIQGIGLGLFQVSCLEMVTGALPRVDRGVAGSLVMVTRTIGIVLGASLLTMVFVALREADDFLIGFQSTILYTAGFLGLFLAVTCARPRLWFKRRALPIGDR